MPTGSFKDRGASVMLSLLRAQGVQAVLEDSSGNGGAAIAAYAAAGGMRAKIMVPASTSPAKTVQSRATGAEIELVPGSRQDCADAAMREAASIFYASHNWHPFFLQGTKTLAYELWEDLGFRAPDNVIVPCGAGSNVLGCGIGFAELLRAGQIDAHAAHLRRPAGELRADRPRIPRRRDAVRPRPTIAEGTAIAQPIRARECIGVLRQPGRRGDAVRGRDRPGLARPGAERRLCRADLRPGGRGLRQAAGRRDDQAGETTVVVLTGTGLKSTPRIAELLGVAL